MALTALFAFVVYEYMKVDAAGWKLRFVVAGIGVDKVATAPEPEVLLLDRPRAQHRYLMSPVRDGMSAGELETLRAVSSRFAYGAVRFRFAQALALNGDPQGARLQMAVINGMYGEQYYAACMQELEYLARTKYPQLATILTP